MPPSLQQPTRGLTGNHLKLIAALTMLIDHIGMIFFPKLRILRIIGRLSFPIFAYMIAEGCHYTKNRLRYFLNVFVLGIICEVVSRLFGIKGSLNILLTFSCSIPAIYLLQLWKEKKNHWYMLPFAIAIAAICVFEQHQPVTYGFRGIMIAVFVYMAYPPRGTAVERRHKWLSILFLTAGLLLLARVSSRTQYYSLLAPFLLLLYSGKRGKDKYKYAFYLFYPLHLAVLQGIAWLIT